MVLATKKNCQRVLAASLRVVSAMTGNPPLLKEPTNDATVRSILFSVRVGQGKMSQVGQNM